MRQFIFPSRSWGILLTCAAAAALAVTVVLRGGPRTGALAGDSFETPDESKVRIGFEIAPVELNLTGKNRELVGLGSYVVNAHSSCSECHTWPIFAAGGNPYLGEPEQINTAGYLAGGRVFPPLGVVSRNLTPDPITGKPAHLTFEEFELVMRTGVDLDGDAPHIPSEDNDLLQVMPWPVFSNMTNRDLRAVYEYLRAIPSVP